MNNRKYLSRLFLPMVLLAAVMLSSCTNYSNTRLLKKFVSRFNAEEYACASTYIYPEDRMQLAFFANEVRPQCPSCFVKVLDTRCENDYMVVELKWMNANDFLRNYFANIGIPLTADDVLHDTITIRETTEGTMLSFEWGILDHNTSNLSLASISAEGVDNMNIRAGAGLNYRVIGSHPKGKDILIEKTGTDWSRCYTVDIGGETHEGYIYTKNMSMKESAFFSLGLFDSLSLLVAVIILVVLCLPLYFISSIVGALFSGGPGGILVCVALIFGLLYTLYQVIEKILFELFIINLPY